MRQELDGARHCVNEPAKDHLDRLKRSVPLAEFLDRVGVLLRLAVVVVGRSKDLVDAVKEDAAQPAPALLATLSQENEIIHVGIHRPKRPLLFRVLMRGGRPGSDGRRVGSVGVSARLSRR